LEPMLKDYYKTRGYDDNGIPETKRLQQLGILV
jgi:aldehyde:ferredoxin oxidoreductase